MISDLNSEDTINKKELKYMRHKKIIFKSQQAQKK